MIFEEDAMAKVAAQGPAPPTEVLVEFLHALHQTVNPHDQIVPVLRGSTLLRRWFGEAARPAADIDLEWFPQAGWGGRFASPLEHARGLCMFAVGDHHGSPIAFDPDIPVPSDGVSLWDYGTPGVRCYTGWTWAERNLHGVLQVDVAQAGSYDLTGVATESMELPREGGEPARVLAYAPEMLLAAKLSWIVRHVQRNTTPAGRHSLTFLGEPKDLFDAHLLLTEGRLRSEVFQSAFLAVAMEDKLDWNHLDVLLDPGLVLPEGDAFPGWIDFSERHQTLSHRPPSEMLRTVPARLRPLLGDLRQHLPFLHSIQADPVDEGHLLVYADWLEERADSRADFLRLFGRFFFHDDRRACHLVASSLSAQPGGWLYYVFGGPERARAIRKRIGAS
jgi:uncharacterized protein (TIGR02996 family)